LFHIRTTGCEESRLNALKNSMARVVPNTHASMLFFVLHSSGLLHMLPFHVPMEFFVNLCFWKCKPNGALAKILQDRKLHVRDPPSFLALRNKNFAKYPAPTPPKLPPILTLTHLPQPSAATLPFPSDPIPHRQAYPCPAPPRLSAPSSDLAAEAARHGRRV
jgi:hypothetical protein